MLTTWGWLAGAEAPLLRGHGGPDGGEGVSLGGGGGRLLGEDYSETEVRVRSTDVDRVLMTAQCILAGAHMEDMLDDALNFI